MSILFQTHPRIRQYGPSGGAGIQEVPFEVRFKEEKNMNKEISNVKEREVKIEAKYSGYEVSIWNDSTRERVYYCFTTRAEAIAKAVKVFQEINEA